VDRRRCASRLIRHDLCARLTPLDHYGLADFASVLVDGALALANLAVVASRAFAKQNA
jgi:hypothetical protein